MTPFVHQSHDKFEAATTTVTDYAGESGSYIRLRHHSSPQGDTFCVDLNYTQRNDAQPLLIKGELILLLNDSKRYSLRPKVSKPATYYEDEYVDWAGNLCKRLEWNEYVYYEISEEILREMAYATSIEIKVIGASVSKVLEENKVIPSFFIIAKALYNAIFDNSAFLEDLNKEKQRIKEAKIEAELKEMAEKIDDDEEDYDEDEEDYDEEYMEIRREAKKRKETDGRILVKREWKELEKKCEQHNSRMGAFVGRGCTWDTKEPKFTEYFGKNPTELYNHLEFSIPLYESLLSHMHEYNLKHPKAKVEIDYEVTEPEIRKFIAVLKQSRDNLSTKKYKKFISYDSHLKDVVRKSDWKDLNNLIWAGGIAGTIFVGGIWSLVISSWKPMFWFGVVTVILGSFSLYMRSYYDSKIEEYNSTHK